MSSLYQYIIGLHDKIYLYKDVLISSIFLNMMAAMFEFYFRCESSAKNKTNIESQVSTFVYIRYMLQQKLEKLCLFTFPVQLVSYT
jgi:hypothetical protein